MRFLCFLELMQAGLIPFLCLFEALAGLLHFVLLPFVLSGELAELLL